MSHIKNYDILLSAVVSVFVGLIVMLSDMFSRLVFWGGLKDDRDSDSKANGILMLLGLIFLIISPISSIWSTHPSTSDRIEALRNIK